MATSSGALSYWLRRHLGYTEVRREKVSLGAQRMKEIVYAVLKHRMGGIGVGILVFFVAMSLLVPFFPLPPPEFRIGQPLEQPNWSEHTHVITTFNQTTGQNDTFVVTDPPHYFGTDFAGRDILSRVIWGSRISLMVGLLASVIAAVLGTLVGLASGYWGGWKDELLMRVNDMFLSLPWLALLIVLAAVLGGTLSLGAIVIAIGVTSWNFTARVVRAQVLSVKERVFVERARAVGASSFAVVRKHIFPNVFPLVFANTILTVAIAILSESTLAFLGKVDTNNLSWGVVLRDAEQAGAALNGYWVWIIMPGLALVVVVLGFSLLGFALDEVLNPRLRER